MLQKLIGQPLVDMWRVLNMAVFAFGDDVKWISTDSGERTGSRYALHVQCPFRLLRNGRVLVGSDDLWVEAKNPSAVRSSEGQEETYYDLVVSRIVRGTKESPLIVRSIRTSGCGDLALDLSDGVAIEVVPTSARPSEAWRFLERGGEHVTYP